MSAIRFSNSHIITVPAGVLNHYSYNTIKHQYSTATAAAAAAAPVTAVDALTTAVFRYQPLPVLLPW